MILLIEPRRSGVGDHGPGPAAISERGRDEWGQCWAWASPTSLRCATPMRGFPPPCAGPSKIPTSPRSSAARVVGRSRCGPSGPMTKAWRPRVVTGPRWSRGSRGSGRSRELRARCVAHCRGRPVRELPGGRHPSRSRCWPTTTSAPDRGIRRSPRGRHAQGERVGRGPGHRIPGPGAAGHRDSAGDVVVGSGLRRAPTPTSRCTIEGMPHAFMNTMLFLDYDRTGLDIPVVPLAVNCYGRRVISRTRRPQPLRQHRPVRPAVPEPEPPHGSRRGAARGDTALALAYRPDRLLQLVPRLPGRSDLAPASRYAGRPRISTRPS